jgi:hypothetical protein
MKTLLLIGNGFDLGHGLPTRFDDFIDSNPCLYRNKYDVFRNGNNSWNEIESKYEELIRSVMEARDLKDLTEELDIIRSEYGLNDFGEVNYCGYEYEGLDEELERISDLIQLLKEFEYDFLEYLKTCCNDSELKMLDPKIAISQIIKRNDRIITFNYTHTAEIVYGAKNVIHIHGDIDDSITIGSGALEEAKLSMVDYEYPKLDQFSKDKDVLIERMNYYEEDLDGGWVEAQYTRRFFDVIADSADEKENELFDMLDSKSKDSLLERQDVIDALKSEQYDLVYIIGHSLGKADLSVFNAINKGAQVIYYYHKEEECAIKQEILRELGFETKMISDTELYA